MIKSSNVSAHALGAVALFVALGGTAMANDSVRALITGADVRNGTLTGRDVRDRSITRADLAPGALRAGAAGPAGPAGPQGPQGERGQTGPAGPDLAGATHVRVRGDRTPAENGEALRAALASITDASTTRPYVLQLAPGVYELGDTTLAMKPDVSIAGAGAAASRITGDQAQASFGPALVRGADRTLLRDLTVVNRGAAPGDFHTLLKADGVAMRIEDTVLDAPSPAARGYALIADNGSAIDIRDSRLDSKGAQVAAAAYVLNGAEVRVRGSELVADSPVAAWAMLVGTGSTAVVETSAIVSSHLAIYSLGGTVTVGASRVVGTSSGQVTCAASYDDSFAPLGAGCT